MKTKPKEKTKRKKQKAKNKKQKAKSKKQKPKRKKKKTNQSFISGNILKFALYRYLFFP